MTSIDDFRAALARGEWPGQPAKEEQPAKAPATSVTELGSRAWWLAALIQKTHNEVGWQGREVHGFNIVRGERLPDASCKMCKSARSTRSVHVSVFSRDPAARRERGMVEHVQAAGMCGTCEKEFIQATQMTGPFRMIRDLNGHLKPRPIGQTMEEAIDSWADTDSIAADQPIPFGGKMAGFKWNFERRCWEWNTPEEAAARHAAVMPSNQNEVAETLSYIWSVGKEDFMSMPIVDVQVIPVGDPSTEMGHGCAVCGTVPATESTVRVDFGAAEPGAKSMRTARTGAQLCARCRTNLARWEPES